MKPHAKRPNLGLKFRVGLLVLLRTVEKPVSGYGTKKKLFNVPFLIDTGSPQTFLCEDDYKILGIEAARNVYIEDVPCRPQISTEHFMDINLLGTDVLKKTSLFVDYTNLTHIDSASGFL